MQACVVIATKGRPADVYQLLGFLAKQTLLPARVCVVGVTEADVVGIVQHPFAADGRVQVLLSQAAGLCIQRNLGLTSLLEEPAICLEKRTGFVAFFDDDFRPDSGWLARARDVFVQQEDVVALTGRVLADGVHGTSLQEHDAEAYLNSTRAAEPHWASGDEQRELDSMYGCNMAFRDIVLRACRFDESLPFYGWQEDQDYTSQARGYGRSVYEPGCRGVHLGASSGRVSGLRFGYSQIANPLYLARKGTMSPRKGLRFVARHLVANAARSLGRHPRVDYAGRLRGNMLALLDVARGRCHPLRVKELR